MGGAVVKSNSGLGDGGGCASLGKLDHWVIWNVEGLLLAI